jgi:dTDP-4-amino-4,6-dideoxygalactose transaminase
LWYYEQQALGFNYRMTDMQAALGVSQLAHIDTWLARRRQLVQQYEQHLTGLPLNVPKLVEGANSAWHLYVIQLDLDYASLNRRQLFDRLLAAGIGVNVHYIPVYWQPYYRQLGFKKGYCPNAEAYYERAISIPMYASLTDAQQAEVISLLTQNLGH